MLSLPDYTFKGKLHSGADTTVYHGVRNVDNAPIIAKVPRADLPSQRELAKLFHEYSILSELELPNVPKVFALEKAGPSLALVMQHVDAPPLSELIEARSLDLETALYIASSLAETLDALHKRAIIHKDIKPQNILFHRETQKVWLLDFGISTRLASETQTLTPPSSLEGTLLYLSPEQTGRMNRVIDRRSDFYSLGVVLYEMLTGTPPFQSDDPMQLVYSHIARTPVAPHERVSSVPRMLSAVVLKLLAKTAEERYQDAIGLKFDLDECLRQWRQKRRIVDFPLGQQDRSSELRIPQKLYGREHELTELLSAFDRVRKGAIELLLLSGAAGIGKSALVQEIHKSIAQTGGYYAAGKFDQLVRSTPYAAIAHALNGLIRQILSDRADSISHWREQILGALGTNGQILIDMIPDLQLIIGPQPPVPLLGPTESQNRFNLVFQNLFRVFATRLHPLVLVLDDLQWVDPASLRLLRQLLTDQGQHNLLIVGAFRDNEVSTSHALSLEIEIWRKEGVVIRSIQLNPLVDTHLREMLKDALGCDAKGAARLAGIIGTKTHGNPLFVIQFLTMLYEERLLYFDPVKRVWEWDDAKLAAKEVTDNVVELMIGKLRKLPENTQRLLMLAACIGHEFDLNTLIELSRSNLADTSAMLWPALQGGLVVPVGTGYRLVAHRKTGEFAGALSDPKARIAFRFLHDRMRQAAYELLPATERPEIHQRIGRSLLNLHGEHPQGGVLFAIADHLNHSASLTKDSAARLQLARLNLAAGMQAKRSTAHIAAASYLRAATDLFDESTWTGDHDLCFQAYEERAACEYLSGEFEQAGKHFEMLHAHARSELEQARVYNLQLVLLHARGRFEEGLRLGVTALKIFGIELPADPPALFGSLQGEMVSVMEHLGQRSIASLLDAPVAQEPRVKLLMLLLMHLHGNAFIVNPVLAQIFSVKQVNLSLTHGNSATSCFAYISHAGFLAGQAGQYRAAFEFGKLAVALSERFDSVLLRGRTLNVFACFVAINCEPVRTCIEQMRRSMQISLEVGDFPYASYSCIHITLVRLALGDELATIRAELSQFLALTQQTRMNLAGAVLLLTKQFIAALEGHTASKTRLDDSSFDEVAFLNKLGEERLVVAVWVYYGIKLQLAFLYEDYVSALAMAREADSRSMYGGGCFTTNEVSLYTSLTILHLLYTASPEQRTEYEPLLAKHRARLEALAKECPQNFQHQVLLIQAESAAVDNRTVDAMQLYDQAIALAQQSEFVGHEAVACELAAKFYLRLKMLKIAGLYMSQAHHAYVRWGATEKATQLTDRHGHMLMQAGDASPQPVSRAATTAISTRTIVGGLFDITALMRATQSISMEIMLDKVLNQVLRIVLTTSGAQRGFLILTQGQQLMIAATTTVDQEHVDLKNNRSLDEELHIARSIVAHVARSNDTVVLADATRDPRFSSDPHVTAARPKSVLCMSLSHQGRPIGVIYLENNLAFGAFRSDRIELLRMLCSQAAIAVENARLYAHVQAMTDQLRESNSELNSTNQRLLAVTGQLEKSNAETLETNARLQLELRERARAEEERQHLQSTIIATQQARLAELSTPLIPLTDKIMVLPLIGTVDSQRAEQVLETVLNGSTLHRTDFVIIDITGLRHVDTSAANSLIKTASALRLLGAEAVLTGIRAEVAQTLVSLGIDLRGVVTRGTLQSGIAYALNRSGGKIKSA